MTDPELGSKAAELHCFPQPQQEFSPLSRRILPWVFVLLYKISNSTGKREKELQYKKGPQKINSCGQYNEN